jgi:hypothetical protein
MRDDMADRRRTANAAQSVKRRILMRSLDMTHAGSFEGQPMDIMNAPTLRAMAGRNSPLRCLRTIAPYVAIEVLLPGGSLIAFATWLYRRRRGARAYTTGRRGKSLQSAGGPDEPARYRSTLLGSGWHQSRAHAASCGVSVVTTVPD